MAKNGSSLLAQHDGQHEPDEQLDALDLDDVSSARNNLTFDRVIHELYPPSEKAAQTTAKTEAETNEITIELDKNLFGSTEQTFEFPATPNQKYSLALADYGRAINAIEQLSPDDRNRWREFQISLGEAKTAHEADAVRKERDEAFPGIAEPFNRARQQFDAGRHLDINIKLSKMFWQEAQQGQFQNFLKNADISTKEGLVQRLEKSKTCNARAEIRMGSKADYFGIGTQTARSFFEIDSLPRTTSRAEFFKLSAKFSANLSPADYANKLATDASATKSFTSLEISNPLKTAAERALREIDAPDSNTLVQLKSERLFDRLVHEFETNGDLKSRLKNPDALAKSLEKFQTNSMLGPHQKLEFIKQMERLTDSKTDGIAPLSDRFVLAGQILHQSQNIASIDQGKFKTCVTGVIEKVIYSRKPEAVAGMITDVALTGKTENGRGQSIDIIKDSVLGGLNAKRNVPPTNGARSLASQYFAMICANERFREVNKTDNGDTHIVYSHENGMDCVKDTSTSPASTIYENSFTGEFTKVKDGEKAPPGFKPLDEPGLTMTRLLDVYEALTNTSASGIAIASMDEGDPRVLTVKSPEELEQKLTNSTHQRFPLILVQPDHVATIDGFNPTTGLAEYDNQWGSQNDRLGADGLNCKVLFDISRGKYHFEQVANPVEDDITDDGKVANADHLTNENLLAALNATFGDPNHLSTSIELAKELNVRCEASFNAQARKESAQALSKVQKWLREGKTTGSYEDGTPYEQTIDDRSRFELHVAATHEIGRLDESMRARKLLADLYKRANRTEEADAVERGMQEIADTFPSELIQEQKRLLQHDAEKYTGTASRALLESLAPTLRDPREYLKKPVEATASK